MDINGNAELVGQLGWHWRNNGAGIMLRGLSLRKG
jgi:hypothetical protein